MCRRYVESKLSPSAKVLWRPLAPRARARAWVDAGAGVAPLPAFEETHLDGESPETYCFLVERTRIGAVVRKAAAFRWDARAGRFPSVIVLAMTLTFWVLAALSTKVESHPARTAEWVSQARGESGAPSGSGASPYLTLGNQGIFASWTGDELMYPSGDPYVGPAGTQITVRSTRTDTAWASTSALPAAVNGRYRLFFDLRMVAASDDLGRQIFVANAPLTPDDTNLTRDIYLQDVDRTLRLLSPGSDADTTYVGRSADASHVIFQTTSNLVPEATGGGTKLYEWNAGLLRLVGILPDGSPGQGGSDIVAISDVARDAPISKDGARIVFQSPAAAQSTGSDPARVYVRIEGSYSIEASASQCTRGDCSAPGAVKFQWVSADGNHVFMTTDQQLLDEDVDDVGDLYRYDVGQGVLSRLSAGIGVSATLPRVLGASKDGSRVYFDSLAGLAVWDHGQIKLLGGSSGFNPPRLLARQGCGLGSPEVTPDGRFLMLPSSGFDPDGPVEAEGGIWHYSLATDEWSHVAPESSGALAGREGGMVGTGEGDCQRNYSMTDDGAFVFFQTNDPLTSDDADTQTDVYEWHDDTVELLSQGNRNFPSRLFVASRSGRDVFFGTFDPVAPTDEADTLDVYDARIGGRESQQRPLTPPNCSDDDCQGPSSQRLGVSSARTAFARPQGPAGQRKRRPAFHLSPVTPRAEGILARTGRLRMRVTTQKERVRVDLVLRARLGARWIAGDTAYAVRAAPGTSNVTLRLSSRARRYLEVKGRLRLRLDATSAGETQPTRIAMQVVAPKERER